MKVFYLFLIALLIVGCGPSAEQMTATVGAARALTQTAAPTLTSTATFTPSPSPTITASPTPATTSIQGRVNIWMLPAYKDEAVIPIAAYKLTLNLKGDGQDIAIKASDADGSFTASLLPGKYVIDSITMQNPAFGPESFEIATDNKEFEVPAQSCYNAGGITFKMLRLPPGSVEEQAGIVQELAQGEPANFVFSEYGGFVLPALTEIAGSGNCPELPAPPNGFDWKHLPESTLAVLAPDDWYFLSEQNETMRAYYITAEDINLLGSYTLGMSINVIHDETLVATRVAKDLPAQILRRAGITTLGDVSERQEGNLFFYEFEYEISSVYNITVHNMIVADQSTNALYIVTFESPSLAWDRTWPKGKVMLEQMLFLDNQ